MRNHLVGWLPTENGFSEKIMQVWHGFGNGAMTKYVSYSVSVIKTSVATN